MMIIILLIMIVLSFFFFFLFVCFFTAFTDSGTQFYLNRFNNFTQVVANQTGNQKLIFGKFNYLRIVKHLRKNYYNCNMSLVVITQFKMICTNLNELENEL